MLEEFNNALRSKSAEAVQADGEVSGGGSEIAKNCHMDFDLPRPVDPLPVDPLLAARSRNSLHDGTIAAAVGDVNVVFMYSVTLIDLGPKPLSKIKEKIRRESEVCRQASLMMRRVKHCSSHH